MGKRSAAAAVVVTAALLLSVSLAAQIPLEPVRESGQSITGAFEGWYKNADGTFSLLAGYFNRNSKQTLDIPVGPNNKIEPGNPDQGQPTHFLPRRQWGVFTITVPKDFGSKRLTWTITANGQTTTIPMHLDPLWVVEPFKDAGIGNTPPVIRLAPGGPPFTGPPKGFAAIMDAAATTPLPLVAWATDDGIRPPEALARAARLVSLTWSKFRGPGTVSFTNAKPEVDADGKAASNATFDKPGEYVLRLQANDATGEGGAGFQCCWSNVHIKVNVK